MNTSGASRCAVVTGCAGFIGSHLTEALLNDGWHVHGVDKLDDYYPASLKLRQIAPSLAHRRFTFDTVDLADAAAVAALARRVTPDVIVHLAAVAGVRLSISEPSRYVRANVVATQNVLDAWASGTRLVPIVFASSSSVYGNGVEAPFEESRPLGKPPSPYAATKHACELLCHVAHSIHGAPISMLRLFTVYGPRQRPDLAIRKFSTAVLRGRPITVFGDGSMARDFTHVSDIVRGVIAAMGERQGIRAVNLGNSSPVSVSELVRMLGCALGVEPIVEHCARPPGEMDVTYACVRRAEEIWGWTPRVKLVDGLEDFAGWIKREEAEGANP